VSVDIRCSLKGNKVDCDKPMAPGSEALLACKIAYQLTNEPGYNKVICQPNGNWDKPVFTCLQGQLDKILYIVFPEININIQIFTNRTNP
jgi:hypothetical protein